MGRTLYGRKKGFCVKIAALFLSVIIFSPLVVFSGDEAREVSAASTAERLAEAKNSKTKNQEELEKARQKVAALSGDVNALSGEMKELAALNEAQKEEYKRVSAELEAALIEKQRAFDAYILALETLEAKKLEYSTRMSIFMEYQNKSVLEILLSSDSISGFFTQLELISLIGEADKQAMEDLRAASDDADLKKKTSDSVAYEMTIVTEAKQAELDILAGKISATQANLDAKRAALDEWEQKEDAYEAYGAKVAGEIKALESQLTKEQEAARQAAANANNQKNQSGGNSTGGGSGGGSSPVSKGMFSWPYPGQVSGSGYGNRIHPVYGYKKFHNGLDIGGNYGDKILAAADGVVTKASAPWAGQNTGGTNFGNHIYIDHGNGYVTIYAHAKNLHVSVGDVVTAGQHIADVGSTGLSTGPHLHFEVRYNGTPTNPADYYK